MKHTGGVQLAPIDEQNPLSQKQQQQINLPVASPQPNLPRQDLLAGPREDYIRVGIPLYEASITGDWKAAIAILDQDQELLRSSITENHETALHVAASAKRTKRVEEFVENLVDMMKVEDLELQNSSYNTALCLAAAAGNVKMVKIMLKKNRNLLTIPGGQKMMPLYVAALFGDHDMVKYLYDVSKLYDDGWTPQNRGLLLLKCVESDLFDIALRIVDECPDLAANGAVLGVLARKPDAFVETKSNIILGKIRSIFAIFHVNIGHVEEPSEAMRLLRIIWGNVGKLPKHRLDDIIRGPRQRIANDKEKQDFPELLLTISENIVKLPTKLYNLLKEHGHPIEEHEATRYNYPVRVLFVAAENGNTEFVVELICQYPDLIWKVNDDNESIFHVAVSHRHEGIYNLLYEIGSMKDLITPVKDRDENNLLHLVGKNAKKKRLGDVSGYALQMQRELLWFKEVEAMIPPSYRERKNKDGLTPHELFTKEHKELFFAGEKWMKDTASQCMVVAALIATIVFAAAFTVPGGYNQNNGVPIFLHKRSFLVFVIADALSLTFSSISILVFLSIHIASYFEQDFLETLPKKLMKGLATLFFSIASMMVAFGASFFILYENDLIWVPIVVSIFASIPVILYARLQYDLLGDFYRSTYDSKNLFKPKKRNLRFSNPQF